jgi:diguanylate cyclase (GGDEF)-like protein
MIEGEPIRVLLIEDNPIDSLVTGRRLLKNATTPYALTTVDTLAAAWPILEREEADVVLADLNLPDSEGLETLVALRSRASGVPVVVLTAHSDQGLGVRAVQMGAQDYLQKGELESTTLQRAVVYAIERHRLMVTLRELSLVDALTGLYNRRGLLAVGGTRIEVARRLNSRAFVLFGDLDHLKTVNDEYGHAAGDTYLLLGAEALKQSFRAADVIARVGGDEFVVLGLEMANLDPDRLSDRVSRTLDRLAREHQLRHPAVMTCGVERFDPNRVTMEQAIEAADAAMYGIRRLGRT